MVDQTAGHADFLIVGGGSAGCATAITLVRAGARVVLVERAAAPGFKPGEIIDSAVYPALADLGLAQSFEQLGFPSLTGNVSLWDGPSPRESPGILNPHGHGVLIDRARFEAWLLASARDAGVDVQAGAARLVLTRCGRRWRAECDAATWEIGFVVEATGRSSGAVAPLERHETDRLVCMLAYAEAPSDLRDQRLHLEAVDEGWWYSALLPDRKLVVALVVDRATVSGMSAKMRTAWFWAAYRRTRLLSNWVTFPQCQDEPAAVRGFPANSSLRQLLHGPGWLAVGDAAATYDPLLGRGLPLALVKGAAAARLLLAGDDFDGSAAHYANAELEAFHAYLHQHRQTYGRAGQTRQTAFWRLMGGYR